MDNTFGPNINFNEKIEKAVPSKQYFLLGDRMITIEEDMDLYNSYRKYFLGVTDECMRAFSLEYTRTIHDLTSYLELFPQMYGRYLGMICSKAKDVMISEGKWDETLERLFNIHISKYHMALSFCEEVQQAVESTSQNNADRMAFFTSFVPELVGFGYGFEGIVESIITTTAYNLARDGIEAKMINNARKLKPQQQAEIYGHIDYYGMMSLVNLDFGAIVLTVAEELRKIGKDIWMVDPGMKKSTENMVQNIGNPNFPPEKRLDAFLYAFKTFPYNNEYFKALVIAYGDTDQTREIRHYFGFDAPDRISPEMKLYN